MTGAPGWPELHVPAASGGQALMLRPWRRTDIPALATEMSYDYLLGGMWSGLEERPFRGRGTRQGGLPDPASDEREAARWIASQNRGWRDGDRLCFAVHGRDEAGGWVLAGNVGLKNRDETGRIGARETAETGYWTAVAVRGRGIAPAAVIAVTGWVFEEFAGSSLRQIMLVHDVGNPGVLPRGAKGRVPVPRAQPGESAALANRRAHPHAAGKADLTGRLPGTRVSGTASATAARSTPASLRTEIEPARVGPAGKPVSWRAAGSAR